MIPVMAYFAGAQDGLLVMTAVQKTINDGKASQEAGPAMVQQLLHEKLQERILAGEFRTPETVEQAVEAALAVSEEQSA